MSKKKDVNEWVSSIGSLLSGVGNLMLGLAAFLGIMNADKTFEKITELSSSLREVKELSIEIRGTLNRVRDDIKRNAVKSSGVEAVTKDTNLTPEKVDTWLKTIPSQLETKMGKAIFIPQANRQELKTLLLQEKTSIGRQEIVENFSTPIINKYSAKVRIDKDHGTTILEDNFGLMSGKMIAGGTTSEFFVGDSFKEAVVLCWCQNNERECTYDKTSKSVQIKHLNKEVEYRIYCSIKK